MNVPMNLKAAAVASVWKPNIGRAQHGPAAATPLKRA